jgi:hypothetical protein
MVPQALVALPITLPVVPESSLARLGLDGFRKDFADTVAWSELMQQVRDLYRQISPTERQITVAWPPSTATYWRG